MPNSDQGIGILFGAIGIGFLLWLAGKAGFLSVNFFGFSFNRQREKTPQELEWDREDQRNARLARTRQLEDAFGRYSEAAVAIVSMVESTETADRSLSSWFDLASSHVAAALTVVPEDFIRVAVWADLGDPACFHLLGSANLDRNDPRMRTLAKEKTIGGHAWRSKKGEYLCVDVTKDRRFVARSPMPRPYQSILAVRVGDAAHAWGVVTIDAPRSECFSETSLILVRRFAKLLTAGAAIAGARFGPTPGRVIAAPWVVEPARIVASSAPESARPSEGGTDES